MVDVQTTNNRLMNRLLSILLVSCMFAGELEVEGDLNVSGEVQSPTIEALLAQIADLQNQLNGLQGGNRLETRIFEINIESLPIYNGSQYYLSLPDYLGFNSEYIIKPYMYIPQNCSDDILVSCEGYGGGVRIGENGYETNEHTLACSEQNSHTGLGNGPILTIQLLSNSGCLNDSIKLWITSEFPSDSDVQLRNTNAKKQNLIKE